MRQGLLFVIIVFTFSLKLHAKVNRYIVYFKDKEHTTYSLSNPKAYLSPRAIARRKKQNIPIQKIDIPVNTHYLQGLKSQGAKVYYTSKWLNAVLIEIDEDIVEKINQLHFVKKISFVAPGSKFSKTYHTKPSQKDKVIKIKESSLTTEMQLIIPRGDYLHHLGFKGAGMLIAVFDGGFKHVDDLSFFDHLMKRNKIKATFDFTQNLSNVFRYGSHGTEVLSTLAGYSPPNLMGAAYEADYILCTTEDSKEYLVEEFYWLFAAEWADSIGVDVISSSLGYHKFSDKSTNYSYQDMNGQVAISSKAASIASKLGILVVVSAGNEGHLPWKHIVAPADAYNVLAIGAIESDGNLALFSSTGPSSDGRIKPNLVGLGTEVVVGKNDGSLNITQGTSFSTPIIAGLSACFWQANPTLTNLELITQIQNSASHAHVPNNEVGYGIPNFKKAMQYAALQNLENSTNAKIYPTILSQNELYITLKEETPHLKVRTFNSKGNLIKEKRFNSLEKRLKIKLDLDTKGVLYIQILSNKFSEIKKIVLL